MNEKLDNVERIGPLIQIKCPECDKGNWFQLIRSYADKGFLAKLFTKTDRHFIQCEGCEFLAVEVDEIEAMLAKDFSKIAQSFRDGNMEPDAFMEKINDAKLKCIHDLAHECEEKWTCSCGEKNDGQFGACWKCNKERPA